MIKKIVTIVVSHNRAKLLTRCIEYLRRQTYPIYKILIVDNGSEFDVRELINCIKLKYENVELLLQENLGGAGGFSNGMKYAIAEFESLDFLWLMDDDGYPTENALKELVDSSALFDKSILNSLVVSNLLTKKLSFPFYHGIDELLDENNDIKYFVNKANFFNGTFIPKSVILRLGFPISKLFVKGDELEYFERALMKLKIPMITVRASVFVHPSNDESMDGDISIDKLWHVYFNLRNFFYSHRFDSNITASKKIQWIIRLYKYFRYWRKFKRDFIVHQVSNKETKKRLLNLVLWHVITDNYSFKPADIKLKFGK